MKSGISVIIPSYKSENYLPRVLEALAKQTKKPDEVILVDSSNSTAIDRIALEYSEAINIKLIKIKSAYPGEARNIGINNSNYSYVAFLDTKTLPRKSWLETYHSLLKNGFDLIFGKTRYKPINSFQENLCMNTFGKDVETTPGTMLKREALNRIGYFIEKVRASDDLDWRNRAKDKIKKIKTPRDHFLIYDSVSTNLFLEMKRQFIYQLHSAKTDAQSNNKVLVFGTFLILLTLSLPNWNALVGWEQSLFYIPNVTKIFLINLLVITLIIFGLSNLRVFRNFFYKTLILSFGIMFFFIAQSWNNVLADWTENSFYYFPHITKIYIFVIFATSFLYRSIVRPLQGGFKASDLFPIRFLTVGLVGVILDIVKVPGYFFGGFLTLLRSVRNFFLNHQS